MSDCAASGRELSASPAKIPGKKLLSASSSFCRYPIIMSGVGADDTVFDAVRKMAEENIGSLIVCEGSKVIGIITERHYARNVFLEGRALPNTRVGDVMETPVLFVRPGLTAEECMAVMTEKRVRYLPVIDEGKLTGTISIGDLVKNKIGRA